MAVRIRVAQEAPAQAPARLPASRLTTTVQCGARSAKGTATRRAGSAVIDHGQTHRLVEDDGLQGEEPEQADQQRQPELRTAQPDHAAQQSRRRRRR